MRRRSTVFAVDFDKDRFRQHMLVESPLEVVLRGHLWTEAMLDRSIAVKLQHPHHVDLGRLAFVVKAELAASLGLVPSDALAGFRALNRIRNRIAHDLDFEYSPEQEAELVAGLGHEPVWLGDGADFTDDLFPRPTRIVVVALVFMLDHAYEQTKAQQQHYLEWLAHVEAFLAHRDEEKRAASGNLDTE